MEKDWHNLEGVDAAEKLMRAAVDCKAKEIHISCDSDGAALFFVNAEQIDFFDHIPIDCRDRMRDYLKERAAIDLWVEAPATGFGVYSNGGNTYNMEVNTIKRSLEEDLIIRLTED